MQKCVPRFETPGQNKGPRVAKLHLLRIPFALIVHGVCALPNTSPLGMRRMRSCRIVSVCARSCAFVLVYVRELSKIMHRNQLSAANAIRILLKIHLFGHSITRIIRLEYNVDQQIPGQYNKTNQIEQTNILFRIKINWSPIKMIAFACLVIMIACFNK